MNPLTYIMVGYLIRTDLILITTLSEGTIISFHVGDEETVVQSGQYNSGGVPS